MNRVFLNSAVLFAVFWLGITVAPDDNDRPVYGGMGLPVNCRAYVDSAVAGFRIKKYTAEETMAALERNCGAAGESWKNRRN